MHNETIRDVEAPLFRWRRAFSLRELCQIAGLAVSRKDLARALRADSRLICLSAPPDEDRFIWDKTLFQWFFRLNVRLARVGVYRLTDRQLSALLSQLRREGRWDSTPSEAIRWASESPFALVCAAFTPGQYVFPLARFLSLLPSSGFWRAVDILQGWAEQGMSFLALEELLTKSLDEGLSLLKQRTAYIVKARTGLLGGGKRTLKEIGIELRLSRERVRQIEAKFWRTVRDALGSHRPLGRPFLVAWLCDLVAKRGGSLAKGTGPRARRSYLLAQCAGLPIAELPTLGLLVLGVPRPSLAFLEASRWPASEVQEKALARRLESDPGVCLKPSEVKTLAKSIARCRRASLRCTKGITAAVTEVVRNLYERLGEPVPLRTIAAEIRKERKWAKPASIHTAAHHNPALRNIPWAGFVPKDAPIQVRYGESTVLRPDTSAKGDTNNEKA